MNILILQITEYLTNNKFFDTIKDKEKFAKLIFDTYANRIDLLVELKKANCWLVCNPNRRKKSYSRFLCNWLLNCCNKYGK